MVRPGTVKVLQTPEPEPLVHPIPLTSCESGTAGIDLFYYLTPLWVIPCNISLLMVLTPPLRSATFFNVFKPQKLPSRRLETAYGPRTLPNSGLRNRFFLLEDLEALWMKSFVASLLQHFVPTSLIWLHDGIWISPAPARHITDTANRLATSQSQISDAPLHLSCTPLATLGREVRCPSPSLRPIYLLSPPSPTSNF